MGILTSNNPKMNTIRTKIRSTENIHHSDEDKHKLDVTESSAAIADSLNQVSLDAETPAGNDEVTPKRGQYTLPPNLQDKFNLTTVDSKNPFTSESYVRMLELFLYLEEQQMIADSKKYKGKITLVPVLGQRNFFELHDTEFSEYRPDRSLQVEQQAVNLVKKHGAADYFFPKDLTPQPLEDISINYYNDNIRSDVRQQQAIRHILSRTSYPAPYLIYGPPGTGKTVTIVETVLQIVKLHPGKNILVCAPSNRAANVIANRLCQILNKSQMLRFVAFSFPFSEIPDDVKPYCNYHRVQGYYDPSIGDLTKYAVIVTTLGNAGKFYNIGLPSDHFSYVFVDECGYAIETETLIALAKAAITKNSPKAQVVLAGDPNLQGPIVYSHQARLYGFGVSMLERLMCKVDIYKKHDKSFNENYITKLLTNYSSHNELMKISNEAFYENELTFKCDDLALMALGHEVLKNKKFPLIFHNICGNERSEKDSPSLYNLEEVEIVLQYVSRIIGTRMKGMLIKPSHIGVISLHRKQAQKIEERCVKLKLDSITIGTVEKFQGTERLIIVISTVHSKMNGNLNIFNDRKRFNVAMTRSKALIIVVGNGELLHRNKLWRAYIKTCKENGNFDGSSLTGPTQPPKTQKKSAKPKPAPPQLLLYRRLSFDTA